MFNAICLHVLSYFRVLSVDRAKLIIGFENTHISKTINNLYDYSNDVNRILSKRAALIEVRLCAKLRGVPVRTAEFS